MMCLSVINFEKRFEKRLHGAFHNLRENHSREVNAAPVASDFLFAI
jgi:hypothetical protein